ncbi:MAG: TonB-dependent receptor, partial [Bryobacterales bacterium]|nr:TonB-dependent receptor [Bryobacterales bacterium]
DMFNPTAVAIADSNNRRVERAASDFDVRQVFVASWLWEVPRVRRWGWVGRSLLDGLQANGIMRADSGTAFTVTSGRDSNFDGNTNDRPDWAGDPSLPRDRTRDQQILKYFNTAAFKAAPDGTIGNVGRSILYGPGSVSFNLGLFKKFRVTERHSVQFRAELFNAFNHTNLSNPNAGMNNTNFGRILGSAGARVVQFGLKYAF